MRPHILYELSQELALLLEKGLREAGSERGAAAPAKAAGSRSVPVFLGHPLDPLGEEADRGATGILCLVRLRPERRYQRAGLTLEAPPGAEGAERLRLPGLWVSARYVFLVSGGSLEDQLGAMEAALRTLHDTPCVRLGASGAAGEGGGAGEGEEPLVSAEWPLRLVDDGEGWKELGLAEHRLTLGFEVVVCLPSARAEPVERTLERELAVGDGGGGW